MIAGLESGAWEDVYVAPDELLGRPLSCTRIDYCCQVAYFGWFSLAQDDFGSVLTLDLVASGTRPRF